MGTVETESALVSHPDVAEAAVVGYPHPVKGQSIYAFVTLNSGVEKSDELKKTLVVHVRKEIGPIATPEILQWSDFISKSRSGKIMRRILKKIAAEDFDKASMGDTSTLADPTTVDLGDRWGPKTSIKIADRISPPGSIAYSLAPGIRLTNPAR